ncbi:MAG: hypothetical protein K0B09_15165, partial [Bacteroidales bacterium]|nr:hypothetical protein [Bacteroidales bacterium]
AFSLKKPIQIICQSPNPLIPKSAHPQICQSPNPLTLKPANPLIPTSHNTLFFTDKSTPKMIQSKKTKIV